MFEPVQWIALGWALVNKEFADALYLHVGPNAFPEGAAGLVYDQIAARAGDAQIRELLGLEATGKLSKAVLKYLAKEGRDRWAIRTRQSSHGKAKNLAKTIEDAMAGLLAMARHDGERRLVEPYDDSFYGGEGI